MARRRDGILVVFPYVSLCFLLFLFFVSFFLLSSFLPLFFFFSLLLSRYLYPIRSLPRDRRGWVFLVRVGRRRAQKRHLLLPGTSPTTRTSCRRRDGQLEMNDYKPTHLGDFGLYTRQLIGNLTSGRTAVTMAEPRARFQRLPA